jgi:hypothetical protein
VQVNLKNSYPNAVVISQPMYFPWVGLLEQISIAHKFVHYNDVQYVRGFFNRVQIKTINGLRWLTVPLKKYHQGQLINEVKVDDSTDWRTEHRKILQNAYKKSPFVLELLNLFDQAIALPISSLSDLSRNSTMVMADYFGLTQGREFFNSEDLCVAGKSSKRLLKITQALGGQTYITGHGARNYLDHHMFESAGVSVRYMNYQMKPYNQLNGPFTPFVTSLDLVANCGKDGLKFISPLSLDWKEFIK